MGEINNLCSTKNSIMKPKLIRLCIYPKDVQRITGKSERYSRDLINKIKTALGKQPHQVLSVEEFCTYIGLNYEAVKEQIIG